MQMQWHVAIVKPNTEIKATSHLMQRGYPVMMPAEWHPVRSRYVKADKRWRRSPLFGRYLFVAADSVPRLLSERYAAEYGGSEKIVARVVYQDGRPAVLPPHAIEAIRGLCYTRPPTERAVALHLGQRATLPALGRQEVTVAGITARRVRVVMDWFKAKREVEVPIECVEAA